jgi:ketol-acid reductoisomerase
MASVQSQWHHVLTTAQEYFKNDTLALIGYGSQGHGQGLNLRDNGLNVIVGVRKNGASWKDAVQDGWVPGKNLFDIDEAIGKSTIVMNLLSDAAQSETWPAIKPQLKGKVRLHHNSYTREYVLISTDSLLLPRLLARLQGPHQGRGSHRH